MGDAAGRIPCPFCGQPIPLSVDAVLQRVGIPCLSCGAEISIDAEKSREALSMLARWRNDTEAVRQLADPQRTGNRADASRRGKRPPRR